jgi:hypothetical protein
MKNLYIVIVLVLGFGTSAYGQQKELALYCSPIEIDNPENFKLLYKHYVNKNLALRFGFGATVQIDKETRNDTVTLIQGKVTNAWSLGFQRELELGSSSSRLTNKSKSTRFYVGADAYYNSEWNRRSSETYYGYYWNFGVTPVAGISINPFKRVKVSLEALGNFNVNLQEYSAPGDNFDNRIQFRLYDRGALSIGYLF